MSEHTMNRVSDSTPDTCTAFKMNSTVITVTWLFLSIATVFSWWIASGSSATPLNERMPEHIFIIVLAIFKMYLVIAIFMGMFKAPVFWHLYSIVTLLIIGGLMLLFTVIL